jgi:hypothetical protein
MFERATVRLSDRLAQDANITRDELTNLYPEDIELPREDCSHGRAATEMEPVKQALGQMNAESEQNPSGL